MIYINGLKELPKSCNEAYKTYINGKEFYCNCPCYHESTADGPSYCSLKVLINKTYFYNNEECPLREGNLFI